MVIINGYLPGVSHLLSRVLVQKIFGGTISLTAGIAVDTFF